MNPYQELWWRQAKSDLSVLVSLRGSGAAPCHQLHYLQMVTEKLYRLNLTYGPSSPTRDGAAN